MIPRGSTLPQSKLTERLIPVIRETIFELSTEKHHLLRTLHASVHVDRNGPEDSRNPPAQLANALTSEPSRHTRVAGSQGACLSVKPSVRGVVPAFIEPKNPGNAVPIAPWPVTPKGVLHVGIAEYPLQMAEEGHGEKGGVLPERNVEMQKPRTAQQGMPI